MVIFSVSQESWLMEDGNDVTGTVAIREEREILHKKSGMLSTEKINEVINKYLEVQNNPENFITNAEGGANLSEEAYRNYRQGDDDVLHLIRMAYAPEGENYDYYVADNLVGNEGSSFYDKRLKKVLEYLNTDYSFGNYSEEEKEIFLSNNQELSIPFYYDYHVGWKRLLENSTLLIMGLMAVISICLAGIFAYEYQSGADAIVLSSYYGRNKLICAKLVSGFLVGSCIYLFFMALLTVIMLCIYGVSGWNCDLQVMCFLAQGDFNLLEVYLFSVGIGYLGCMMVAAITMMLSAKMSSSFPVIVVIFLVLFVPMFIPYSKDSRMLNHLLNLFLIKMANVYSSFAQYELYNIFAFKLNYTCVMVLIALVGIVLPLLFAYKSFKKHQVQGR